MPQVTDLVQSLIAWHRLPIFAHTLENVSRAVVIPDRVKF
jgi:hypothetical protein